MRIAISATNLLDPQKVTIFGSSFIRRPGVPNDSMPFLFTIDYFSFFVPFVVKNFPFPFHVIRRAHNFWRYCHFIVLYDNHAQPVIRLDRRRQRGEPEAVEALRAIPVRHLGAIAMR